MHIHIKINSIRGYPRINHKPTLLTTSPRHCFIEKTECKNKTQTDWAKESIVLDIHMVLTGLCSEGYMVIDPYFI